MSRRVVLLLSLLLAAATAGAADWVPTPSVLDLAQAAADAKARQVPVMLVIGSEDCAYCARLEREILHPAAGSQTLEEEATVLRLDRETGGKVTDFDGNRVRTRIFIDRLGVFATPTVLFLDDHGAPLHRPLVGYNGRDDYLPLLNEALRESHAAMASAHAATATRLASHP